MSGPAYFRSSTGDATFEGIEWDLEYALDLGLRWRDSIGGRPRATRMWADPYVHDIADFNFTLWTNQAQAQNIELLLPGLSTGWAFDLGLPGLSASAAFPGFGNYSSGIWSLKSCTLSDNIESMGCKGPRLDLFGYRVQGCFSSVGAAAVGTDPANERGLVHPTGIQAIPAVLAHKFAAHQLQRAARPARPLPIHAPTITGAHNGQRIDSGMSLDHLSSSEADEVVTWARGQRDTPFAFTNLRPFGPAENNTVTAILRGITVNRGAGWWWDIKLDLTKV